MYYGIDFSSQPRCTMFGRYRQHDNWIHSGKTAKKDLLLFIIDGNASFQFQKTVYSVSSGNWLLIPKGTFYSASTPDFCEYYFLHFDAICENTNQLPPLVPVCFQNQLYITAEIKSKMIYLTEKIDSGKKATELTHICNEMNRLMLRTSPIEQLLFNQLFGQLLLILSLRVSNAIYDNRPPFLKQAIVYIQNNYTKQLSLAMISDHLHVSSGYLLQLFRKHMGMTVITYINLVKLNYAAELLKINEMNITQISNHLGYSDSGYFSRLFRKQFGISPSKFAQNEKYR